jgi:hypothetical protein
MNSALPGQARTPGAAEAERVRQEVARLGWRLDALTGVPAQRVPPAGPWYALTAAFSWFHPAAGGRASPWPRWPAALFALTIAAATGVALLPAAAARRHRP